MIISPDSQAMLLLCSQIGLSIDTELKPLTLREWNPLARKLSLLSWRPGDLLGLEANDLQKHLEISEENAKRFSKLLMRGGGLAIELERLANLGIHPLTRVETDYPQRYRDRLKDLAPAVLCYSGNKEFLGQPGLAVVGSRNLDDVGRSCAEYVGNACGFSGLVLYSGGARGVDTISMKAALETRGFIVGILADSLEKTIRKPEYRSALSKGDACFVTNYHPSAGFSVGAAMGRNRLIYTLADYAVIIASDVEKGGTWAGATEALKANWLPVFVLEHPSMPQGNRVLLSKGANPLPFPLPVHPADLKHWLDEHIVSKNPQNTQLSLF